jgi:4-amino-4-deoxy-L-arabinose transferase-like glycosyltransferase
MKDFISKLTGSLDNHSKNSFSARKLSALAAIMAAYYVTYTFTDITVLDYVLTAWLCFALLCLGIITAQQVIELKNGKKEAENKIE